LKASDLFVKALENEGVEYIFGVPGEENLDLLESIRKSKTIKFILTRHEQAAAFMAATYGKFRSSGLRELSFSFTEEIFLISLNSENRSSTLSSPTEKGGPSISF
jgi:TPP-dependent 2-oxoacid decarboxylase